MFTTSFYINLSDKRHVNKNLTFITSKNCMLKDDTSIYKPTLIVDYDKELFTANYIYIAETKRYYFIDNITLSQQRMFIECSETDVLMSFKNDLLSISATLERQSNIFNTYLTDSEYQSYAYSHIQTIEFPNSLRNTEQFILCVTGGR